jgi:hypothetical protein
MDFTSSGRYYHRHSLEQRLRLAHDRWHIRMATLYLAAILRARRSSLRSSPGQTDGLQITASLPTPYFYPIICGHGHGGPVVLS